MIKYVKNSVLNFEESKDEYILYDIPVFKLQPFKHKIDLTSLLKKIESLIPYPLLSNVDIIYVSDIEDFNKNQRSFNAMYADGAIYLSPDQDNKMDLLDDIVHEIAHSLEQHDQEYIYGDLTLEEEFLSKRRALYHLINKPTLNRYFYDNPLYNHTFDNHLYHVLSYDYLRDLSAGLFYSPYAITSLREYWANGFENYLLGDRMALRDISPILYNKVEYLINSAEEIKR